MGAICGKSRRMRQKNNTRYTPLHASNLSDVSGEVVCHRSERHCNCQGKMETGRSSWEEAGEAKIVRRGDRHVITNVKGRALAPRRPLARLCLPAHGLSCAEQKGVLRTQSCIAPTHTHTHTSTHTHKHTNTQAHKHTSTQAHKHTNTPTHKHTNTQTHTQRHNYAVFFWKEKKMWNFDRTVRNMTVAL